MNILLYNFIILSSWKRQFGNIAERSMRQRHGGDFTECIIPRRRRSTV